VGLSRTRTVLKERKRINKLRIARTRKQVEDMTSEAVFKVSILPIIAKVIDILNDEKYDEGEMVPSRVRVQIIKKHVSSFELYKAMGALDDFDIEQESHDTFVFSNKLVELI
jgi:hypothetical protein